MNFIRTIIVTIICLATALLAAAPLPGKPIGPEVSQSGGRELKWEEGSRDYFIMHRTMLSRSASGNPNGSAGNPQADGCLTESTYTLFPNSIPDDAVVTDAFLVWTTAHTPDNPNATSNQQYNTPTDNTVSLSFTNSVDGAVTETRDINGSQAYVIGAAQNFEFESAIHEFELQGYRGGVYTYRVEVTDFFNTVLAKARDAGMTEDGKAYEGAYKVSGLACYTGDPFYKTTMMISNWALFFVYTSSKIQPKKIYVYNGFNFYQYFTSSIFVSGFEFPDDPTVRVSLMVAEGDPGLYLDDPSLEGLQLRGDPSLPFTPLTNICNPPVSNYHEVYNSISSSYPWDATADSQPYCIGGVGGNTATPDLPLMEWAIDVDTFILNNTTYPGHLAIGDKDLELQVGANQDTVFTNLMIVSLDTKAPKFDIPESASTALMPQGREKNGCSCGATLDRVCDDRPFYYLIKVQNWGENLAKNVTVQDTLPDTVDYIAGSTEMATMFNEAGDGINWTTIPDSEGGAFPLETPFEVAGEMLPCEKASGTCANTVLVRFLVQPKEGLPKNAVIENTAVLSDVGGAGYFSNSAVPLRVRFTNCPLKEECESPDPVDCGGNLRDTETPDDDQTKPLSTNIAVEYAEGANSPQSDSPIIIPPSSPDLTLGQFTLKGTGASASSYYQFKRLYVRIQSDDTATLVRSIRLVHDANGNGIAEAGEETLGSPVDPEAGTAAFVLSTAKSYFAADTLHYFLILADISYSGADLSKQSTFRAIIENKDSLLIADAGTPVVTGPKLEFVEYMLEPTSGYFIFTKAALDPPVPPIDKLNSEVTVLNLRAKALDGDNGITAITVSIPDEGYTKLGKGITKIRLYEDVDKDAEPHTKLGDKLLGEITSFDDPSEATFSGLTLTIPQGGEKYLLLTCTFALDPDEKAKVVIPNAGVKLSETKNIIELPIASKEFVNSCDPADPNCVVIGEDEGGCGCAVVEPEPTGRGWLSFVLLGALGAVLVILIHRRLRKNDRE